VTAGVLPEFKGGNYPRGVGRGLNRIAHIVRRDLAAVAPHRADARRRQRFSGGRRPPFVE
jgi:hypothetical protein